MFLLADSLNGLCREMANAGARPQMRR